MIKYPDKKAFKKVCADLEAGNTLTMAHVGEVFGTDFWVMIVMALMDSQDAARAIQGAIQKLREGGSSGNSSTA